MSDIKNLFNGYFLLCWDYGETNMYRVFPGDYFLTKRYLYAACITFPKH